MICPVCGTHVSDSATVCPACHAVLNQPHTPAHNGGVFCKNCGALVPPGRITCPNCGFPLDDDLVEKVVEREAGENKPQLAAGEAKAEQVESVIPAKPSDGYRSAAPKEHMPHTRVVLLAALCAILVVAGTVLLITQPWNPESNIRHALTDADTSMAGYPGEITRLTGQDKTVSDSDDSDPLYDELSTFYSTLSDISSKADSNEETLRNVVSGQSSEVSSGANEAEQLSLDLSNAITEFQNQDFSSSPYVDQAQSLTTLSSYLRNRLDAMSEAWSAVKAASSPTDAYSKVSELLDEGSSGNSADTWKNMFDSNYEAAQPQQQSS